MSFEISTAPKTTLALARQASGGTRFRSLLARASQQVFRILDTNCGPSTLRFCRSRVSAVEKLHSVERSTSFHPMPYGPKYAAKSLYLMLDGRAGFPNPRLRPTLPVLHSHSKRHQDGIDVSAPTIVACQTGTQDVDWVVSSYVISVDGAATLTGQQFAPNVGVAKGHGASSSHQTVTAAASCLPAHQFPTEARMTMVFPLSGIQQLHKWSGCA